MVQTRVQIANRFITKKELDSAYLGFGEINEAGANMNIFFQALIIMV